MLQRLSNEKMKAKYGTDLTCLLFGRCLEDAVESVFEKILMSPTTSDLIKLIWNKMDLSSRPDILNLVSKSLKNRQANNFEIPSTEKLLRRVPA